MNGREDPGQGGEFSLFGMAGLRQARGRDKVRMQNTCSACPVKI